MNRRGFLELLLGAAGAAATTAVVPKSYFFAPVGGWQSDLIVNPLQYDTTEIKFEPKYYFQRSNCTIHGDLSRKQLFAVLDWPYNAPKEPLPWLK